MKKSVIDINGTWLPCYSLNSLIIGSGAAALNAAVSLYDFGQNDILIVTDLWGGGTSNNTGSDKQTYYKMSTAGNTPDSPREMAGDLFQGGCMHGDIALVEALNSLPAFFNLVRLGVPFPHDRLGGFIGYKTDFDPRQRATSAGPLTSQLMVQALSGAVKSRGIPVFDRHQVIALLTRDVEGERNVIGALAMNVDPGNPGCPGFIVFNASNIILGTGGPAGIYRASVYPECQVGSSGMALDIGAVGQNLGESQFGMASIKFRWNLSGTYQQVIPRYFSTDPDGGNKVQFLNPFFPDMGALATAIFLKGYQWPFDPRKIAGYGSSLIDLLVYRETIEKGRRVFLDYTQNPSGEAGLEDFDFNLLSREAFSYLEKSGSLLRYPIDRLKRMNQPAVDLYLKNGIDLSREPLEIEVCAQHNNGGLRGNIWWESNIKHLFPVGEVNGSHGVYRPGGSALNSGQVGGLRAALFISRRSTSSPLEQAEFLESAGPRIRMLLEDAGRMVNNNSGSCQSIMAAWEEIRIRMSTTGALIRDASAVEKEVEAAWKQYRRLKSGLEVSSPKELPAAFRVLDSALTHAVYLEAILEYLKPGAKSRGSYLVLDSAGERQCPQLEEKWRFCLADPGHFVNRKILEIRFENGRICRDWVEIRPLPDDDPWFENVWKMFRNDEIIKQESIP